jgi:KUP system potassium uptake protein
MSQKASAPAHPVSSAPGSRSGLAALSLAALGIVFGDIGTSPLYRLKAVLSMTKGTPTPDVVLGVLWRNALYIAMERNSVHVSDFFRLPNDSVVLIGRQVVI